MAWMVPTTPRCGKWSPVSVREWAREPALQSLTVEDLNAAGTFKLRKLARWIAATSLGSSATSSVGVVWRDWTARAAAYGVTRGTDEAPPCARGAACSAHRASYLRRVSITAKRSSVELAPSSSRVLGRPYVPGEDPDSVDSPRLRRIVAATLKLEVAEARALLQDVRQRFSGRHRDLDLMLWRNAERVVPLLDDCTDDQRRLVGSYLTQAHAVEAAALTNPSMVPAPDQSGLPAGSVRFLLSLRSIGEGHLSSIAFRVGTVDADGMVAVDDVGPLVETGERRESVHGRRHFADKLRELGADAAFTSRVLDRLPRHFTSAELEQALAVPDDLHRAVTHESLKLMRWLAASNYLVDFDTSQTPLTERLLFPEGPFESRGMEDARFVRFTDVDGSSTYYGTYTAYDGYTILPQLIETHDFARFEISTLSGQGASNKGMALFPRLVGGSYVALSRPDREGLHLLRSEDVRAWKKVSTPLRAPREPWETVQMGNCGSPIETEHGWIVLTHGVGPMRTYRIGAMLLDLEHPDRILGDLPDPILEATGDERDGYVPNVVYSCGAMRHGDHLVLPYGASDQRTKIATLSVSELLEELLKSPPPS